MKTNSINQTPKRIEDFIEFLASSIHHGEVIEVPPNAFLAIFVKDANPDKLVDISEKMLEIQNKLPHKFPICILPYGEYKLQVYEGEVYVGNRDQE